MIQTPSSGDSVLCCLSAGYVGGHFLLYATAFRRSTWLQTERSIFAWHAISYLLQPVVLMLVAWHWDLEAALPSIIFAAALHGIYSLSFLELWSLTQGSYSLGILAHVSKAGGHATPADLGRLQSVGQSKQSSRQADLGRMGLVRPDGTRTLAGRLAAIPLRTILWLSNGRSMN